MATPTNGNIVLPASTIVIYAGRLAPGIAPTFFNAVPYVFGLNSTNYLLGWPAAYHSAGVTEYEYSLNGGATWTSAGTNKYAYITGRTASTTDQVRVRAIGTTSNVSTPISLSVNLPAVGSPNVIVKVIGTTTAGYPAPDYATGQLWANAGSSLAGNVNLVTANTRLEGLILPGEYQWRTEMIGMVTSNTCYRHLSAFPGAAFCDNPNRRTNALRYNPANGTAILVNSVDVTQAVGLHEANSRVSRLQIQCNGSGTNPGSACTHTSSVGGNTIQEQMLLESAILDNVVSSNYGPQILRNSVVVSLASTGIIRMVEQGNGCLQYGVTFIAANSRAPSFSVSRHTTDLYRNCAIFGCDEIIAYGASGYTAPGPQFVNCITDANPALHTGGVLPTGCTAATYASAGFENTTLATRDFRIKSGSPLINAGVVDTVHSPIDIMGSLRPTSGSIDVGGYQYNI